MDLDGDGAKRLLTALAPAPLPFLEATEEELVDLDLTFQGLALGGHHRPAQLLQSFVGEQVDVAAVRRFASRAEELGFSDLWTQEVFLSAGNFLDALELMSYVAALTERVRLGVSMMVLPRHNPVVLAKRLATMDQLSGGRVTVGLTVGPAEDEFVAVGVWGA